MPPKFKGSRAVYAQDIHQVTDSAPVITPLLMEASVLYGPEMAAQVGLVNDQDHGEGIRVACLRSTQLHEICTGH